MTTITIPAEALNRHGVVLGKTGSGKTYAAKGAVEKLLEQGRQVVVVDPTSAWWGLRAKADGSPGHAVLVLGGPRGDLPLAPHSGELVAQLVTTQRLSVVCDTSELSVESWTRWWVDFGSALYRLVKNPLHLVIDEVHNFAPQSGAGMNPQLAALLHTTNRLFSGGRSRGIRLLGITQRPQKFHKDSLTCADWLVAMRVIAPQDRDAVKEWVDGAGDKARAKEVLDSLAGLKTGEGWVWYPDGNVLVRGRFPKIATFDSSATPTGDEAPPAVDLASVDLGPIRAAMETAEATKAADDPKLLRKRIAELEDQLDDRFGAAAVTRKQELDEAV